jgi:hypothetical protein
MSRSGLTWVKWAIVLSLVVIVGVSNSVIGGGGISGSGAAQRFRSIVLNDVEYFTDHALILVNGIGALVSDLRIGQVMDIKGHLTAKKSIADLVSYRSDIIGPIEDIQVDPDREGVTSLLVLGQPVLTSVRTNFDGTDVAELKVGDVIELSGRLSADGVLKASFSRAVITDQFRLVGIISSAATNQFSINQLNVDTSNATIIGFDPLPTAGQRVEVIADADALSPLNVLSASSVEYLPRIPFSARQSVEFEDLVHKVIDAQTFVLGESIVRTDGNTTFRDGTPLDRTPGTRLEVEGTVDANGMILADVLIAKPFRTVLAIGIVEAVEPYGMDKSVTIAGLSFTIDTSTDFGRSNKPEYNVTSLEDVHPGHYLKVRGFADGEFVVATRIDRLKPRERTRLTAPLTAPLSAVNTAMKSLTMRGVTIKLDADRTKFSIDGKRKTQAEFLLAINTGDFLEATWRQFTSISEPVDELELDHE